MNEQHNEIIIINATVLTMDSKGLTIPKGYVRILGDAIAELGPGTPANQSEDTRIIDASGGIVMPGMVNTHTHIPMSLFRSLADDRSDRLWKILFPLEQQTVTPELVYRASLFTLVEMIQGGVTCFADMYYFEEEVAKAADQAGMRCILGETVLNQAAPDAPEPYGGLKLAEKLIEAYADHPLITPAVAPHATYTLDEKHMRDCGELSATTETPFLIHLAEMPFEMEKFRQELDMSPVAWMHSLGLINHRMTAAHCIYVDSDDMDLLRQGDAGVAHNMAANIKSGKGVAPVPEMLERSIRVGLGTDGPMSGNTMDIINQLGYVAKVHKLIRKDPTAMPARTVVELATIGGARALHMEEKIGSLEPGKKADIIIVSTDAVSMNPLHDPWSALVYGASPRDVSTVLVNGRILMEDRVIPHLNLDEIFDHARILSEGIGEVVRNL